MAKRKEAGTQKSKPRGRIMLNIPLTFPVDLNFSMNDEEFFDLKKNLNNKDLASYFQKRFLNYFDALSWQDLFTRDAKFRSLKRRLKAEIEDLLRINRDEGESFSSWFYEDFKKYKIEEGIK